MKTLPISRYRFFQKIQPLTLLKKITHKSVSGCLQVFSASGTWSFYMQEGQLIYACYSEQMFEPLYRNLQHLSQHISTLPSGINEQLQIIFEQGVENQTIPNPDYLAICWLVNQKYISKFQAAILIEQLALEVLESFLRLQEGSYELIPETFLDDLPKFCDLDLRLLVEQCQAGVKFSSHQHQQFWQKSPPKPDNKNKSAPHIINDKNKVVNSNDNNKKPYNIFCIDENASILQTIQDFLDENIFAFTGMSNPVTALMEIINVKPDLIFLSTNMSDLDGYEICSLLRKHIYFKNTPVVLMMENLGLIDRAKVKLVRASGYLQKPFNQGDLLKMIFQVMV